VLLLQLLVEYFQLLSLLLLLPALPDTSRTLLQVLTSMFASPLSTQAWISLDCLLPAGLEAHQVVLYNTLVHLLLPGEVLEAGFCRVESWGSVSKGLRYLSEAQQKI
jgi:hypothetical protein